MLEVSLLGDRLYEVICSEVLVRYDDYNLDVLSAEKELALRFDLAQ